ncbi:MAG TPA: nuclear transport factor 2 family protein [Burkholderiaceae bacterium]|nr:nuclear transport factor 2 family protein [Burkholderiaceae bacterium]
MTRPVPDELTRPVLDEPAPASSTPAQRIVDFFEGLTPAGLTRIDQIYTPDAWFKDPFNEVQGRAAITAIFSHMFIQVAQPRFIVHDRVGDGQQLFLTWDFEFRRGSGALMRIRGASHLRLNAQGLVRWHRDYWDAAEELYEKLPLIGPLMRWLKRRAST